MPVAIVADDEDDTAESGPVHLIRARVPLRLLCPGRLSLVSVSDLWQTPDEERIRAWWKPSAFLPPASLRPRPRTLPPACAAVHRARHRARHFWH